MPSSPALEAHQTDKVYLDFALFQAAIKDIIKNIDGYTDSRLKGIVMEMSVIDKTAVVQKTTKGMLLSIQQQKILKSSV